MSKPKSRGRGKKPKQDEERETLAFKVLSDSHTKEVMELATVEDVQEKMMDVMKLGGHLVDLKEAAILDYYTGALWWCREQAHSAEQMSAFFTVVHTLLDNIKDKQLSLVENLCEFKKMLVGIGQEPLDGSTGSGGLECFDVGQAKTLSDYIYTSLFQHYRLYEFMFCNTQAEEIIGTDLELEVAPAADLPWPPPLEEAVNEQMHTEYMATPPVTPAPQGEGAEGETSERGAEGTSDTALPPEGGGTGGEEGDDTAATAQTAAAAADLVAQLTSEQVKGIMQSVFDEMLTGLQTEVSQKLRDKENAFITRINKIHKVAEK